MPIGQGQSLTINVAASGSPIPATGVSAVVFNLTAISPNANTFLTAYAGGGTLPTASNVNVAPGQVLPNRVMVPVSSSGTVTIYNHLGSVNIAVDVNGYFTDGTTSTTGSKFSPVVPFRICDTRSGSGCPGAKVGQGATLPVTVAGAGGVPTMGSATPPQGVVLNVTSADSNAPSFLTVYPGDQTLPVASDVNFSAGQIVPNLVVVKVGSDGTVDIYNHLGSTDVIVDVFGYYS
jgi:hypothetical protein